MLSFPPFRNARALAALALAVLVAGCGREPTGATRAGNASAALHLEPRFQSSGSPGDEVARIRVIIYAVNPAAPIGSATRRREIRDLSFSVSDASRVSETDADVTLKVDFPLQGGATTYEIEGGAYNSAGTQLFAITPVQFTERQVSAGGSVTVSATVVYVGPGADATSLTIAPRSLTLRPGETGQFTATIRNQSGASISVAPIRWRSLHPAVVAVANDRPGLTASVTALAPGTASIVADLEGLPVSDQVSVTVALTPSALQLVSGGGQTAQAGAALANPIVVRLVAGNTPVAGATVSFAASSGGSLSAPSAVTDGNGQAQVRWTLGSSVGTQTLTASSAGVANLTVNATATAPPISISIQSILQGGLPVNTAGIATGQSVTVTALVTQNGQPVSGATVTFGASGSGGVFSPSTATTNASGLASSTFSASAAGTYTLTVGVSSGGVIAATAQTTLPVINASTVTQLVKVSGDAQTVQSGLQFGQPLVVEARNALGQPVAGVALDFTTLNTPVRVTTGSNGRASVLYNAPVSATGGTGSIVVTLVSNPSISVTFTYTLIP
jgi:hypothetical protein